jgi:hypothetical protein
MKNMMKASELRMLILLEYKKVWEKDPNKDHYPITNLVWKPIWEKIKDRTTPEFASAVLASLGQDGLIKNIVAAPIDSPDKKEPLSRITDKGLDFISEAKENNRTRQLAILGAVNGTAGLVISIIKLIIG